MQYPPSGQYPQQPYGQPQYGQPRYGQPQYYSQQPVGQSAMGILSFICAVLVGLTILGMTAAGIAIEENGGRFRDGSPELVMMICCGIVALMLWLVGLVLGIAGAAQGTRKKGFAVAGLIIHLLFLLGGGAVFVIALANR